MEQWSTGWEKIVEQGVNALTLSQLMDAAEAHLEQLMVDKMVLDEVSEEAFDLDRAIQNVLNRWVPTSTSTLLELALSDHRLATTIPEEGNESGYTAVGLIRQNVREAVEEALKFHANHVSS